MRRISLFLSLIVVAFLFFACSNSGDFPDSIVLEPVIEESLTNAVGNVNLNTLDFVSDVNVEENIDDLKSDTLGLENDVTVKENFLDFVRKPPENLISVEMDSFPKTGLPRIVINTDGNCGVADKETYVNAELRIEGVDSIASEVQYVYIRGRGNTTWNYPKKPYALKFEKNKSLFGMPKAKKWVLLANYRDRTLMRNAVAFKIASVTDLEWVPKGVFVDLILNGEFLGNYYLCEHVQLTDSTKKSGNSYLVELDKYYDEENKFRTTVKDFPINIKYPENLNEEAFNYIYNYIDTVESILYTESVDRDIEDYLDFESFADFFIVNELAQNRELKWPKSVYMSKVANDKLKAGPVWDFDCLTFNPSIGYICNKKNLWYDKLFENERFAEIVKKEWFKHKESFLRVESFIDSLALYIHNSGVTNASMWPINVKEVVGDETLDFQDAVDMLKKSYLNRIEKIENRMDW